MEFFRDANIDFLGKKWYFIAFSLIFSVAGVLSMLFWHGIPLGVDFRGGTLVYVKFAHAPDTSNIHEVMRKAGLPNARIQTYGAVSNNEVLIDLDVRETSEKALDQGKAQIINALESNAQPGKQDLNNASSLTIENYLLEKTPSMRVLMRISAMRRYPRRSLISVTKSKAGCFLNSTTLKP